MQAARRSLSQISAVTILGLFAEGVLGQDALSPVRMDPDKMAGLDLTATGGGAYEDILVEGELKFRVATLFAGEELRVSVFESTPATTDHRTRPLDVDEFVLVLSGKLILTEPNGRVQEFTPGQTVVLPRGYIGKWTMEGNYRELAITAARPAPGGN
jgi:uncharacterized cupin superfamily protein